MENTILKEHPEGGLRKVENSRLVGVEQGYNLGIVIKFGAHMTMTQFNEEEVFNLVNYLFPHYPGLKELPQFVEAVNVALEKSDLKKQAQNSKDLCDTAVERMKELKDVIRLLTETIDGYLGSGEKKVKHADMVRAVQVGKEALD